MRKMSFEQHEELLELAIQTAPAPGAEVLKAVKACFYLAFEKRAESERVLESIKEEPLTDDLAVDFCVVAKGSRDAIRVAWNHHVRWVPRP